MPPCTASSVTILPLAPHATKTFITFPWRVYRGDHLWVPPLLLERKAFLNPRKNPFFQHAQVQLFLAQQGKETVGRIAAVINEAHDRFHHEHEGSVSVLSPLSSLALRSYPATGGPPTSAPAPYYSSDATGCIKKISSE